VFHSSFRGKARLRITRTPTVTLSTIGYWLSAIGYTGQSPPAGDLQKMKAWRSATRAANNG
jgi:hypothetical protein